MSGTYKLEEISKVDPKVKVLGITKDGKTELNFKDSNQSFDDNTTKLIFNQTPYIIEIGKRFSNELGKLEYISYEYDNFKLFDLPVEDKIVTFATTKDIDNEQIITKVSNHILNPNKERDQNYSYTSNSNSSGSGNSRNDNALQNFILNYIQYIKEFTIASIHMNEKTLKSFWKKFDT